MPQLTRFRRFLDENGLLLIAGAWVGQVLTGWHENYDDQTQKTQKATRTKQSNFPGQRADYWTRTNDLLITNELLYQLS